MRIVCSLALSLATLAKAQECAFQDAFDVRGDGSLLLRQFVADGRATIQLEYAGTAWLGFAFTEQPVMIPNVAVIGLPDDDTVLKYDLTARSLDGVIPVEDERQTLTDASIFQNSTHTVLTFSKLLEEENEVSANAESNQFNFAIGSSNDLAIHAIRGTATAPFSECVAATADPTADQQTEAPQESPIEEPAAAPVGAPTWEPPTWQPPTWGPPEDPCKAQRDTANACLSTAGSCATCINKAHWDIFAEKSTVTCTEYEDGICSAITAGCMECGKCSGQLEEYFECTMFDLSKGVCRGIDCAPVEAGGGGQVLRLDLADGEVEVVLTPDETAGTIKVEMLYSGLGYIGFGFSDNNEMPGSVAVIALPDDGTGAPRKWDLNARMLDSVNGAEEDRQTLMDARYFQNETHTGMSFEKMLVEDGEPEVSLTENNWFLYAIGGDNELKIHAKKAPFQVNFADGGSSSVASGPVIQSGPSGLAETSGGKNAGVLLSGFVLHVLSIVLA